ncbi:MAG: WYL domain-containing transcriptional regulator [Eubacteriales bacterium]|nr:WYL domain-containing transcriptional regulator [Eubacteriales bacterium]
MAVQRLKLRMLYIYQILMEETDEEHILTAGELIDRLKARYGVEDDRRSVYGDIDTLIEFGVDVIKVKGNDHGYYIGERQLEPAELKILVDAVQVSKFLTQKKSEQLIRKLECLTSRPLAKHLQEQVVLTARPKAKNETVFYNIDAIHTAIYKNRQIQFQYAEWTVQKEYRLRKNGAYYKVSPWALIWDDENYYLNACDSGSGIMKHYRVDKMVHIDITDESREGKEQSREFNPADFEKKTFGMFAGRDASVTLQGENRLVGVIIDRFGTDIMIIPADAEHFRVTVPVTVSQQFFGWMTAIGKGLKIVRPDDVREQYLAYVREIMEGYDGGK